jgi:hypothetical protein
MDVDGGSLYVAAGCGVKRDQGLMVSADGAHRFHWDFYWPWDGCSDVDFEQGVGWLTVPNFGSESGIHRKTPGGSWQDVSPAFGSGERVVADAADPANVAYAVLIRYGDNERLVLRTRNGGRRWRKSLYEVQWTYVANGVSTALAADHYTRDKGETWRALGLTIQAATPVNARGRLVVGGNPTGVFVGVPPKWTPCGLPQQAVVSLATCGNTVFALSSTGAIFRAPISALVTAIGGDALMQ